MNTFLWRALVQGVFVVLPVCLIVFVATRVVAAIDPYVESLAAVLPLAALFPGHWIIAWAVVLFVVVSFAAGLVMSLPPVRRFLNAAGESLARRYPGYARLRGFEKGLLGTGERQHIQAALAELDDALVPVFVVEELPDGRYVVFVPSTPSPDAGAIYILARDRVHLIDANAHRVADCFRHWGVGAGDLVKSMRTSA
ncbi:MAG: hypothetical protein EOP82_11985 [Variovorax sp.]|nr:MAG: hypothetical protein EOP82_11985 [Variovorax sp.]